MFLRVHVPSVLQCSMKIDAVYNATACILFSPTKYEK